MCAAITLTFQEEQRAAIEQRKRDAAANLLDELSGTGGAREGGAVRIGETARTIPELSWGTVVPKCQEVDEKVNFQGGTWLTIKSCNCVWNKDMPCKFVWCNPCRSEKLVSIKKKLGIEVNEETNSRRSNREKSEIDVQGYRGDCGRHTYADLLKGEAFTDELYSYEVMLRSNSKETLKNVPRNCWGCGKLL